MFDMRKRISEHVSVLLLKSEPPFGKVPHPRPPTPLHAHHQLEWKDGKRKRSGGKCRIVVRKRKKVLREYGKRK